MEERCQRVADLMHRGRPWQLVALLLFSQGFDLPDETIRSAYGWAFSSDAEAEADELKAAEQTVDRMLQTRAGRRIERAIVTCLKRTNLTEPESPRSVARSVLANLTLIPLGGMVADTDATMEVFAGIGLPIDELGQDERVRVAGLVDLIASRFSFDELAEVITQIDMGDLRAAVPFSAELLTLIPPDMRRVLPKDVSDLLVALLPPFLVQLRRVAADFFDSAAVAPPGPTDTCHIVPVG